jgi:hypothetical protein
LPLTFAAPFKSTFKVAGNHAHEVADFVTVNEDGLENLIDVFAQAVGHMLCTEVVLVDLVGNEFVRNFLAVENSSRVSLLDIHK